MGMDMVGEKTLREMAKQAMTKRDVHALAQKALELQTSDKFRLAALLLDAGEYQMAEAIGTRACQEIQLAELFAKVK